MTARPTDLTDWATNTNFSAGIGIGTPTKATPGSTQKADGWYVSQQVPPQWWNWWQNTVHQWIRYLRDPTEAGVLKYPLSTRGLTKVCRQLSGQSPQWTSNGPDLAGGAGGYFQNSVANAANYIAWDLDIPDGATLVSVIVNLTGGPGHAGLPSTLPKLSLFKCDSATGTRSLIGSVITDSSVSVGAYETRHTIEIDPSGGLAVTRADKITAVVRGENATNAIGGLFVDSLVFGFTTTAQDDGAA